MSAADELLVSTPQGVSGKIYQQPNGDYVFRYSDSSSASIAVSMTMPPRRDDFVSRTFIRFFQMNLPEGYVLEQLRNRLAKVATVKAILDFAKRCHVSDPKSRIQAILQAVEGTLLHHQELTEQAPDIAAAIRASAAPFEQSFG